MTTNGLAPGVAETPPGATMQPGRLTKSRADRQPILSLVDREYLKSTANIPRGMWEAMSYLYSEADKSMERIEAMAIPAGLVQVREATIKQWHQVLGWLDELLIQSASVEALRSWQLMTGLQQANGQQQRPSAAIMPDYPQPRPPGTEEGKRRREPRGLFG